MTRLRDTGAKILALEKLIYPKMFILYKILIYFSLTKAIIPMLQSWIPYLSKLILEVVHSIVETLMTSPRPLDVMKSPTVQPKIMNQSPPQPEST